MVKEGKAKKAKPLCFVIGAIGDEDSEQRIHAEQFGIIDRERQKR